jgi:peptidyl-prolyl cis-trans isomerase A (cyclophilin A)
MRTTALFIIAGALLVGCPKNEDAQPKSQGEESPPPEQEKAHEVSQEEEGVPAQYTVELDTTKGVIVIDVHRDWAPQGADRFYELVKNGYYTDVAFFRVIGGFMAQVGISGDPALTAEWRAKPIPDDPVKASNTRGTVTFATSGPDSRTTQFFINFTDNSRLDGMGFAPFGKVKDMAPVDALYDGYGEGAPRGRGPSQARMNSEGNTYLRESFPKLDYIKSAKIIE